MSRAKGIYVQCVSVIPCHAMSGAGQLPHGNICSGPASGARENGFSTFCSCPKPSFPEHPVHGVKDPSLKGVVCFGFWDPTQVHK